jgi:transcriptional regulator
MYVPSSFAVNDVPQLQAWMASFSFATVVSAGATELEASHLPLLIDREAGQYGTLLGHFARANQQWKDVDRQPVLAIFHGPHAYISPRWYDNPALVPTWNYVAVHAYGRLEVVDDTDETLALVRRMTAHYEASFTDPWELQADDDWLRKLATQIVGFRIPIDRLEGKAKLSQNHPPERRQGVVNGLKEQGTPDGLQVAALMEKGL